MRYTSPLSDEATFDHAELGQASLEAACLIPLILGLFLLLLQPVCIYYTRTVMQQTAAELARVVATGTAEQIDYRAYALRRLSGIPKLDIFHVGGDEGWEVSWVGTHAAKHAYVEISGRIKLLPLLGAFAALVTPIENGCLLLTVRVSTTSRPEWIEGDYDDWINAW